MDSRMKNNIFFGGLLAFISLFCFFYSCSVSTKTQKFKNETFMLVGTYTEEGSDGIYIYKFNQETGDFNYIYSQAVKNPSYLIQSANHQYIYSVSENNEEDIDAVYSYRWNEDETSLVPVDSCLTYGTAPCYIMNSFDGRLVVTANYMGGSLSFFDVDQNGLFSKPHIVEFNSDIGVVQDRQEQSHLHCVYQSPDSLYLFANDLGADKIYRFDLKDNNYTLSPEFTLNLKLGSGPRHTIFHPNKKWAYLITELSGEVLAFEYKNGNLDLFQTIKADSLNAQGSGDIQITPNGRFIYASNRLKGDGVAIFEVDSLSGELESVGYQETGAHPRNMSISPNGKFILVACRDRNVIEVYEINQNTGLLTKKKSEMNISMPVCIKFII